MGRSSTKWAWVWSLAAHAVLLGLAFLGYRSLRGSDAERLAGLVNTKLGEERDYGEVELRLEEPPSPPAQVALPAPQEVAEVPTVEPPKLEPVETFPIKAAGNPSPASTEPQPAPSGAPTAPAAAPSAPVAPNSGKGSPLHGSVKAGKSIVYVLDCSASMGRNGKLREAVTALLASLEPLTPEVEFQVVAYNSFAERISISGSTDLARATLENKRAVQERLAQLPAEGTSNHEEGLKNALRLNPSAIFLLTDADDLTGAQLIAIGQHNRSQTVIYPILFGHKGRLTKSSPSPLDRLAEANRGRVFTRD